MVVIDDNVMFDPFKEITGFASEDNRGRMVIGTVVLVNYEKGWFSVDYKIMGKLLRTSFKFSQLGKDVFVCGN